MNNLQHFCVGFIATDIIIKSLFFPQISLNFPWISTWEKEFPLDLMNSLNNNVLLRVKRFYACITTFKEADRLCCNLSMGKMTNTQNSVLVN